MTRVAPSLLLLAFLLVPVEPSRAQRTRTVARFAPPPQIRSLLWIAAHPDDELLAAPALALFCRDRSARCTIAVVTRGERGACELPSCGSDLGQLREQELRASATLFSAEAIVGSYPDGTSFSPDEVLKRWNEGAAPLNAALDLLLEQTRPDLVLTFDPRHGSTCHPDHRAIGRAVIEAVNRAPHEVAVGVVRTKARVEGAWDSVLMDPNLTRADFVIDGVRPLRSVEATGWDMLVEVARIHSSQFSRRAVEALENVRSETRLLGVEILSSVPPADECGP